MRSTNSFRPARHGRQRGEPRPFDFRRPSTLSREHVRSMQIVQETLARGFTTTLASSLRAVTQVAIRDIDQRPYDEFVQTLPNPTLLTLLSLPPLGGSAMLQIPLRVAFAATELMLGGRGSPDQPRRAMTDLELALMRGIVELTLPEIRYAFEPIVSIEPAIIGQEANPQFAQLVAPTDMVIVASFDVRVETVSDVLSLCIPFSSLQPHLEALSDSSRLAGHDAGKLAEERARIEDHVVSSNVDVSAVFRPLVASSREVTSLGLGDVLLLSHPVEMPLTLEVGGVATHDVSIGRVNRHLALSIGSTVAPDRRRRRARMQVVPAAT